MSLSGASVIQISAMADITAFILAGGKSSRMGQEKAFLDLRGKQLIEYSIKSARHITDEIFIVGPRDSFMAYGRVIGDIFLNAGPLGGIHAALKKTRTDYNLMLPVDTPFIDNDFLAFMVAEARSGTATVTVPKTRDGLHPLNAVYRQRFLPLAEAALKEGQYKLDRAFPPNGIRVLDLSD